MLKHIFINKIGTITINTFLLRYKFVYSCKNPCFRIQRSLEKHFLPPAGCGSVFPANVVEMLEEAVVDWQEVRGMWRVRQTFVAQFVQLLACRLCDVQSGVVGEKHRALPVDQCWL